MQILKSMLFFVGRDCKTVDNLEKKWFSGLYLEGFLN